MSKKISIRIKYSINTREPKYNSNNIGVFFNVSIFVLKNINEIGSKFRKVAKISNTNFKGLRPTTHKIQILKELKFLYRVKEMQFFGR